MNNVARLGIDIAVRNVKQVEKTLIKLNDRLKSLGVSVAQNSKKMEESGKTAEDAGRKTQKTFTDADRGAQKLTKSLNGVVKKWVSIGAAVQLVSMVMRRAFAKIDEITGLKNMANSAGVAAERIESLGKKLRAYGGDASSAASTYSSIGDIIGAARSGRGISQDIVTAASRYGIALNGGMLTEDQLITNVARAMQAQRKKGNMYGVRDIASAFGIDEAMMLHLSEAGANWDRNLPAAKLAEKEEEAKKAKDLQNKLSDMIDELMIKTIPLINDAMQVIVDAFGKIAKIRKERREVKENEEILENIKKAKQRPIEERIQELASFGIKGGQSKEQARRDAIFSMYKFGDEEDQKKLKPYFDAASKQVASESLIARINKAREYADYYNNNNMINQFGLNNVRSMLEGISGTSADLVHKDGKLMIEVIDKAGVLRNTGLTATYNNGTSTISNSTTGL